MYNQEATAQQVRNELPAALLGDMDLSQEKNEWNSEICRNIEREPSLLPLPGESILVHNVQTDNDAKAVMCIWHPMPVSN